MADMEPAVVTGDGSAFSFAIRSRESGGARRGVLSTPHGSIETPAFIFCGTKAAIKGLTPAQMRDAGTQIILSNTYHLMIQPGADRVARFGGLHRFTGWDGPMLTDSGGFQIFSMGHGSVADELKGRSDRMRETSLLKVTEQGAVFRSYLDGQRLTLTPEGAIDIQRKLGADLIVQLDECTPFHVDRNYTARSMAMSHRWGDRCIAEFARGDDGRQALYGIVQGGVYPISGSRVPPIPGTAISSARQSAGRSVRTRNRCERSSPCAPRICIPNGQCICWGSAVSTTFCPVCGRGSTRSTACTRPALPGTDGH